MPKRASVLSTLITRSCFVSQTAAKSVLLPLGGEKSERTCRYIDEYHAEIGNNLYHICEFAERMEQNGATYEPIPAEPQAVKAPKHQNLER